MPDTSDLFWPPPPPEEPHFDSTSRTWTLSRYADVQAVLRDPVFRQASVEGKNTDVSDDPDHPQLIADLRADTERFVTQVWRDRMVELARTLINRATGPATVNLVSKVIRPWSSTIGLQFSDANPAMRLRLGHIGARLSHAHDYPDVSTPARKLGWTIAKSWFQWQHHRAERELEGLVRSGKIKISRSFYASSTQTLPNFLSKAWLALLLHPDQMDLLRKEPRRMASAVDELLRYAGAVRTLSRRATQDVALGGASIAKGDLLTLRVESANRDPLKFDSPERLDITRPRPANLSLGAGPHACPGASIVRTALAVTTPVFLAAHPRLDPDIPVEWLGDTTVTWPSKIPVRLKKQSLRHS